VKTKLLAFILACMVPVSLVGCGNDDSSQTADSQTDSSAASQDGGETESEPIPLTVEVFDRGNMTEEYGTVVDNRWTKWIQDTVLEELNIAVEFMAIPRSEEVTKLNTLMAAGQEPDVMMSYDLTFFYSKAQEEAFYDLGPSVEAYGDNIKTEIGEDILSYGRVDGIQYAIPGPRMSTAMLASYIRKDWLDQVGIEVQERNGMASMTPTEIKEAVTKFKEAGLTTYPMGMLADFQRLIPIEGAFINPDDATEEQIAITQNYSNLFMWDGVKEAYRYLNECFNEGLINPDFPLYKKEDLGQWIASGQVGFWCSDAAGYMEKEGSLPTLYEQDPNAEVIAIDICTEDGKPGCYFTYAPTNAYYMVSSNCESVDAAVQYINWLCSEESHLMLIHGVEGEHWEYDEEGIIRVIDQDYNAETRISVNDLCVIYNDDPCSKDEKAAYAMTQNAYPESMWDLVTKSKQIGVTGKWAQVSLGRIIEAETEYSTDLTENKMNIIVNSIMCAPEDFDATYDQYYQIYMENGGQQVIDERREAFLEQQGE
jgi:putative aldouronate transport system substrate-binding protein